jgi:hypothetical protein
MRATYARPVTSKRPPLSLPWFGVEAIRALRVARRISIKARTQAANQLHALVSTAPDELRTQLRDRPVKEIATIAARFRHGVGTDTADQVLWRIALVRMSSCSHTRAYVERRTKEGRTKREILRCLKRYIAREIYTDLRQLDL